MKIQLFPKVLIWLTGIFAASILIRSNMSIPSENVAGSTELPLEARTVAEFDSINAVEHSLLEAQEKIASDYRRHSIETQCGPSNDSQPVNYYDPALVVPDDIGLPAEFIDMVENSTVLIKWKNDVKQKYTGHGKKPGDVNGLPWCTGTLIANNRILTAGHCFSRNSKNYHRSYSLPKEKVPGISSFRAIDGSAMALNMEVVFNHEDNFDANVDPYDELGVQFFAITSLLEHSYNSNDPNQPDFAIIEIETGEDGNQAGSLFPKINLATNLPAEGETITVVQHQGGKFADKESRKVVDIGTLEHRDPMSNRLFYSDVDSLAGASGAGVLDSSGRLIGVHYEGGCKQSGAGWNKAWSVFAIQNNSSVL